ncbi:group II intron reverse transcriptase/maturase [Ammoniphilus sp. 3BR4]|uniref:group II intron reverse transcriptase/maturase n=1 Tax=Ammoniphilus sp. 3BR4 TaxID=3158265 RepID=UPI003465348A
MKKRKWYSLYDKVYDFGNLLDSWFDVAENKGSHGVDGETIQEFGHYMDGNVRTIQHELQTKTYRPQPVRRVYIPKADGSQRPLGIPAVRDRLVQQSLRRVIEPIFEAKFLDCSYGFRPERDCHMAIDKITEHLENGYQWVVDADLRSYFDTIPHDKLIDQVWQEISDSSILKLIRMFLEAGVLHHGTYEPSEEGVPQGGVISPLLANIYLHPFDEEMTRRGHKYVRYADDFVILCRSKAAAERVCESMRKFLEGQLGLQVHPTKTRVVHVDESFDFLGYTFYSWKDNDGKRTIYRRPRDKAVEKLKDTIRKLTRRNQTVSIDVIIRKLNPILQGWGNYFGYGSVKTRFGKLDSWMRRRLRAVQLRSWRHVKHLHRLLRRQGYKGELLPIRMTKWRSSKSPMVDRAMNKQWFEEQGLITLTDVYQKLMLRKEYVVSKPCA